MRRWRVFIDGKDRLRSVTAPDEDSARQKAADFYQIEAALLRVIEIKSSGTKRDLRHQLDDLWLRRPESLL